MEQNAADSKQPALTLQALHPGNFALVMATGIISIGLQTLHFGLLADALFVFALGAWGVVVVIRSA